MDFSNQMAPGVSEGILQTEHESGIKYGCQVNWIRYLEFF